MKILIEECVYANPEIQGFLKKVDSPRNEGKVPFVGYMYDADFNDFVFFLPKVILNKEGMAFDKFEPEYLWTIHQEQLQEQYEFLCSFPIWIYRAVNNYYYHDTSNRIVQKQQVSGMDTSTDKEHIPFLENILELVRFANENKNFLLFKMQHMHNGGGKVNWPKTISYQQPFLKKGKAPIYLNPVIKRKDVDYEEELLVIYFSVLKHINSQYGFSSDINVNFELLPKTLFDDYLHGEGTRRLREIRYKYFSDKTLRIWRLCYAFFSQKDKINSSSNYDEYLLASQFDRVFETMVDYLIGYDQKTELPKYIKKKQEDDKIIDHLFIYRSLTNPDKNTYYIADSKYYPTGKGTEGTSFFKQFTYARNLRHEIMSEIWKQRKGSKSDNVESCIDAKTEGYDIIPNFFLSAFIDSTYSYDIDGIKRRESQDESFFHFPNRLFDRETLLLSHYDINFLYVIKQYAINHNESKKAFRDKIYNKFRNDILERLNREYLFYILELKNKPKQGKEQQALKKALDPIFRLVNGKVYCPKKEPSYTNLILALENPENHISASSKQLEEENREIIAALEKDFVTPKEFKLGANIEEIIKKTAE